MPLEDKLQINHFSFKRSPSVIYLLLSVFRDIFLCDQLCSWLFSFSVCPTQTILWQSRSLKERKRQTHTLASCIQGKRVKVTITTSRERKEFPAMKERGRLYLDKSIVKSRDIWERLKERELFMLKKEKRKRKTYGKRKYDWRLFTLTAGLLD